MAKTETNDGTRGGNLKGKPHYDENGKPVGGIKAVTDKGAPVELENGEVVINKEASKKHWQELSRINQSAGNGVPIGPPSEVSEQSSSKKKRGGKIEFNPNQMPPPYVLKFAKRLKQDHPEIWEQGDVRYGNAAHENLAMIAQRGHWLPSEQWMYENWREYVTKHKSGDSLHQIVGMIQWGGIVSKGWPYMKSVIEANTGHSTKTKLPMTKAKSMAKGGMLELTDQYNFNKEESQCILSYYNAINDIKPVRDSFIDMLASKPALVFIFRDKVTADEKEAFQKALQALTICHKYFNMDRGIMSNDAYVIYVELKSEKMAKGGHIGFEGLAAKVAANYKGKKVAQKYRKLYGDFYSAAEAKEVGDKVAGKVKASMEEGGTVSELQMGIEHEKEHAMTAKKLWEHDIPLDEYAKYTAIDHLKEDPKYYSKLKAAKLAKGGLIGNADFINKIPLDKIIGNRVKLTINNAYDNVYRITNAHISPENYTYRDLFITLEGKNFEYRISSNKLQDFLDGIWVDLKDDQGEPYSIELIMPVNLEEITYEKAPKEANDLKLGTWVQQKKGTAKGRVWNVDPSSNTFALEDAYGNRSEKYYRYDPKAWKLMDKADIPLSAEEQDALVKRAFPEPKSDENKVKHSWYISNEYNPMDSWVINNKNYPRKGIDYLIQTFAKFGEGYEFNEALKMIRENPNYVGDKLSKELDIYIDETQMKMSKDLDDIFKWEEKGGQEYIKSLPEHRKKMTDIEGLRLMVLAAEEIKKIMSQSSGNITTTTTGVNTDILSYKNPYEINRAIERLIDEKGEDRAAYTPDEIKFISYYSGYGGLEKQGSFSDEELKGLLYEYYTPDPIVQKMWALAYKYGYGGISDNSVFEPSVGIGAFLKYAPEGVRMVANEINKYSAQICQILYPNAQVILQPFEQNFIQQNKSVKAKTQDLPKFSLVIGNPPYGKLNSKYIGMGEGDFTMAGNFTEYFITRGLDLLVQGGLLIFIVGAEQKNGGTLFLDGGMTKVKQVIFDKADLLDAYRLPTKVFERTGVSSEILVFKKR